MNHEEGFLNKNGKIRIYPSMLVPGGDVKAVLLVVHGLAEHCGRYMNLVNHFVPLGYAVYGFDLPGHGKSHGKRVYVNRFEDYTANPGHLTLTMVRNPAYGSAPFPGGPQHGKPGQRPFSDPPPGRFCRARPFRMRRC
jgi:alpha-beta hydrolase superfamily lysophospholipase